MYNILLELLFNNRDFTIFAVKFDEFHRIIRANGWQILRQMGTSHIIYKKGNRTYPVPYHKGKELGRGLECKIRKDLGIK